LDLTVVKDPSVFDQMRDEWERLLDSSESRSVFLTWEWIRNWWAEYGDGRELFILCLRDGGNLVALFPLGRTEERFLRVLEYRKLGYLGTGESEDEEVCPSCLEPIILPGYADAACDAFAEALIERLRGEWDVLRLEAMDAASGVVRRLEEAFSARDARVRKQVMFQSGTTRLDCGWDTYLRSLGPRTRKKIRRERRILESVPGFEYRFLEDGQDISPMAEEIIRMSVSRWGARSAMSSERFRRFLHAVCRALHGRGRLKLSLMRAEGRVVAANLDFCHKDVIHGYQTGFDAGYRPAIGVGFLSMVYCLEDAARQGYRAYDWYRVVSGGYKEHLINERKDILAFTIYRTPRTAWEDAIRRSLATLDRGVLGKIRKAFREGGARTVVSRTRKTLYRRSSAEWYWCDLTELPPSFDSPIPLTIGREGFPDVVGYMKSKDYLGDQELRVALDNGHWFLSLRQDGVVKGFRKCGFGRVFINDFGEVFEFPDGVAFFYESEVDEGLRKRGVGKHFMSRSLRLARDSGYRFVVCHVPPWNVASQKVVERCGFKKMGAIRFVELAGIKFGPRRLRRLIEGRIGSVLR
jgi:CelD/BcsL family acetyltransferase involved in cellulose biosynthesis/ribosomal protein S18 acetylase RimI-like enzyme